MQKSKINKGGLYTTIIIFGTLLGGCGFLGYQHYQAVKNPARITSIDYNNRHHVLTNYLKRMSANNKNVHFIEKDDAATLKDLRAQLKVGAIDSVTFLMYNDACPRCNREKGKLAAFVDGAGKANTPVYAINDVRGNKTFRKYFEIPTAFHYPTSFTFANDDNRDVKANQPLVNYQGEFITGDK